MIHLEYYKLQNSGVTNVLITNSNSTLQSTFAYVVFVSSQVLTAEDAAESSLNDFALSGELIEFYVNLFLLMNPV